MKAPVKTKTTTAKKTTTKDSGSGFSVNQLMQLADTSVDALKSFTDLKKEEAITQRAQIQGQKEIILGEQSLKKAHLVHDERMTELGNEATSVQWTHEQAMTRLDREQSVVDDKRHKTNRVLDQLEAGNISAQDAVALLAGDEQE